MTPFVSSFFAQYNKYNPDGKSESRVQVLYQSKMIMLLFFLGRNGLCCVTVTIGEVVKYEVTKLPIFGKEKEERKKVDGTVRNCKMLRGKNINPNPVQYKR